MSLVCIEGIDSCGKGIQIEALTKHLISRFDKVETLHFPIYDSLTGRVIKDLLAGKRGVFPSREIEASGFRDDAATALLLQCAMVTNRLEIFDKLAEFYSTANLLILDRYNASAIAYGLADGLPRDFLDRIHEALPRPDHNFLLDISVEESFRRRPERQDAYESDRNRLEKARNNYLDVFRTSGSAYHILDGTRPPNEVTRQIVNIIEGTE